MRQRLHLSLTLVVVLLCNASRSTPLRKDRVNGEAQEQDWHANHIFNAIHSSMRQWGSSWNHNGMSFFLATVPASTEFYIGIHKAERVTGLNWLAFEPEHSLTFAGLRFPPGPNQPQHLPAPVQRSAHEVQAPLRSLEDDGIFDFPHGPPGGPGHPGPPGPPGSGGSGYLHTYRTKHQLSLLYIDGISAAKSDLGTLDSQNYLLLNWTTGHSPGRLAEMERATTLCDFANNKWQSKIDGFIRMELGFEIILCDFEKHLDLVDIIRPPATTDVVLDSYPFANMFAWYQGTSARFDGIGYNRVTLDYDHFITAYDYDVNLFPNATSTLPRLQNLSIPSLDKMRRDVDDLILSHTLPFHPDSTSTNWQAIADMIVTRYSNALPYFATIANLTDLQTNIQMLMRPFINFAARNLTTEIHRCTNHFLPPAAPIALLNNKKGTTASRAITAISNQICTVLLNTLNLANTTSPAITQAAFKDLTTYLDWTVWRRCADVCGYDEVCFIPIWPLGTVEERERGRGTCMNATTMRERKGHSYWGMPEVPPGGGPPGRGGPMPWPGPGRPGRGGGGNDGDRERGPWF